VSVENFFSLYSSVKNCGFFSPRACAKNFLYIVPIIESSILFVCLSGLICVTSFFNFVYQTVIREDTEGGRTIYRRVRFPYYLHSSWGINTKLERALEVVSLNCPVSGFFQHCFKNNYTVHSSMDVSFER